jgi:hypothetical protein
MPAWLLLALETIVPMILEDMLKAGAINGAQKDFASALVASEEFLGKLKIYYKYPGDPQPPVSISNIDR